MKRKPDLETEGFRAWKETKKDKKSISLNKGIEIKYKGKKYSLVGFTCGYDENKELLIAYKVKSEAKLVLYYVSELLPKKKREELIDGLKVIANVSGLTIQCVTDTFESVENEVKNGRMKKW